MVENLQQLDDIKDPLVLLNGIELKQGYNHKYRNSKNRQAPSVYVYRIAPLCIYV